ncbi:MAG: hypothetical protein NVS2B17_23120 [Candidatus Velthaea sp.]
MRDAAVLEALDVPTVVLANDVFRPIAYATGEIVGLTREHVERNVIFFPHPTSNLTRAQVFALVDQSVEAIVGSLLGARDGIPGIADAAAKTEVDCAAIRSLLDPLRASLHEDGAELVLGDVHGGVLHARIEVDEAACADGSCVLPHGNLVALIDAILRERFGDIRVVLDDSRERVLPGRSG